MSLGEKLYFICPSEYAYGTRGAGGVIPPNADVLFFYFFFRVNWKTQFEYRLLLKLNYCRLAVRRLNFEKLQKFDY